MIILRIISLHMEPFMLWNQPTQYFIDLGCLKPESWSNQPTAETPKKHVLIPSDTQWKPWCCLVCFWYQYWSTDCKLMWHRSIWVRCPSWQRRDLPGNEHGNSWLGDPCPIHSITAYDRGKISKLPSITYVQQRLIDLSVGNLGWLDRKKLITTQNDNILCIPPRK